MRQISALARPIDPDYPTNRAIAIITVLVGIIAGALQLILGNSLIDSALLAIAAAGSVFLAWALSRELDPDNQLSAFVSSGLTIISLLFASAPSLLALFWCLWILRILNQSTGLPATVLDAAIALGLGSWLAYQSNWTYSVMTTLVFLLDGLLKPQNHKQLAFAGTSVIVGTAIAFGLQVPFGAIDPSGASAIPWLAITIVFIPVIFASRQVAATCDYTGDRLNPMRLQAAQAVALLTAVVVTLFAGIEGALSLLPLWMAFLGVAAYRIGAWIIQKLIRS